MFFKNKNILVIGNGFSECKTYIKNIINTDIYDFDINSPNDGIVFFEYTMSDLFMTLYDKNELVKLLEKVSKDGIIEYIGNGEIKYYTCKFIVSSCCMGNYIRIVSKNEISIL